MLRFESYRRCGRDWMDQVVDTATSSWWSWLQTYGRAPCLWRPLHLFTLKLWLVRGCESVVSPTLTGSLESYSLRGSSRIRGASVVLIKTFG